EVAGGDMDIGGTADEPRRGLGRDVDQELRRPVLTNPVGGLGQRLPLTIAPGPDLDLVLAEREPLRELEALVIGSELAQRDGRLTHDAALAVVEDPADRIAPGHTERAERPFAHDRLRIDRLAWAVDPPLGEDRRRRGLALDAPGR